MKHYSKILFQCWLIFTIVNAKTIPDIKDTSDHQSALNLQSENVRKARQDGGAAGGAGGGIGSGIGTATGVFTQLTPLLGAITQSVGTALGGGVQGFLGLPVQQGFGQGQGSPLGNGLLANILGGGPNAGGMMAADGGTISSAGSGAGASASAGTLNDGGSISAGSLSGPNGGLAGINLNGLANLYGLNGGGLYNGLLGNNGLQGSNGLPGNNGLLGNNGLQANNGLQGNNGLLANSAIYNWLAANGLLTQNAVSPNTASGQQNFLPIFGYPLQIPGAISNSLSQNNAGNNPTGTTIRNRNAISNNLNRKSFILPQNRYQNPTFTSAQLLETLQNYVNTNGNGIGRYLINNDVNSHQIPIYYEPYNIV